MYLFALNIYKWNFLLQKDQLIGNDRFEGFAVELMTEIAAFLGFNVTFQLVADGKVLKLIKMFYLDSYN